MKLEAPVNPNYCATVVRVNHIVDPLPNSDNLVGLPFFGLQAIVSRGSVQVGELGILFPAEVQLSDEYTKANDLYRHADLNTNKNKAGYLEDNRRVRAITLRGNRSDCLFMPLSSLAILDDKMKGGWGSLSEGDQFDHWGDVEICHKYVIREYIKRERDAKNRKVTVSRVDPKLFPEQFDETHYLRMRGNLDMRSDCVVTQKLHGTSIRIGRIPVARKLSWLEKISRRLGVHVQETTYDDIFGSRRVIKDINNPNQNHFYDEDIWSKEGLKYAGLLPNNYMLYGELIGWTSSGAPIQKGYTYNVPKGTAQLYVYRVAMVNNQGVSVDLSWPAVKQFCQERGLNTVREIYNGRLSGFDANNVIYLDQNFAKVGLDAVPLAPESPCDEGVCVRIEGLTPQIYKHKSPMFLQHETKMLDEGVEDVEASASVW